MDVFEARQMVHKRKHRCSFELEIVYNARAVVVVAIIHLHGVERQTVGGI